jgi:hypothetical protein
MPNYIKASIPDCHFVLGPALFQSHVKLPWLDAAHPPSSRISTNWRLAVVQFELGALAVLENCGLSAPSNWVARHFGGDNYVWPWML